MLNNPFQSDMDNTGFIRRKGYIFYTLLFI